MSTSPALFRRTPLVSSGPAQALVGRPVWFKLENLQPTGSFKQRGVGVLCKELVDGGARHLVCSSGGNAGYAAAWVGRALGVAVTVVVPSLTGPLMRRRIAALGAAVVEGGPVWDAAHEYALTLANEPDTAYVHPFDHPAIWSGHATLIEEVLDERGLDFQPGAVVVSVGGGGLFCGVLEGMHRVGWTQTPVIAVETTGAASFAAAIRADEVVSIPAMTSLAVTLGAKRVCDQTLVWTRRHPVVSEIVTDREAVEACEWMLDVHRMLVEPSCGASLAVLRRPRLTELAVDGPILVIVCGGAAVTRPMLDEWLIQVGTSATA